MNRYLSVDIGGSAIKYGLIQSDGATGKIETEGKVPLPDSLEGLSETIKNLVEESLDKDIRGVAVSMPGWIDSVKGTAVHGGSLKYVVNCSIQKVLQEKISIPLTVENDGKCAALGELWLGELSGVLEGIVIVLGTGIGGGIISNGKLSRGAHLCAGEFSHIRTSNEGDLASNSFAAQNGVGVLLKNYQKASGDSSLDGMMFFDRVEGGEPLANEVFRDYCRKLAFQILNLQNIMDPEKFVIGGGISSRQVVTDTIAESVKDLRAEILGKVNVYFPEPVVVKAKLGNHANLYGALKRFFELKEIHS
ncbi:ROK family protein [Lachnospiraceae bacterium 54-53]